MTFNSNIRVAIVSHAHPSVSKGGAEISAYNLYMGLRNLGVPVLFIAAVPRDDIPRVICYTSDEKIIPYDPGRYNHSLHIGELILSATIVRLINDFNINIINFHHFLFFGTNAIQLIRDMPDIKIFFTLHEFLAICAHHGQMITNPARILCEESSPERCAGCFPEEGSNGMATRRGIMQENLFIVDGYISPSHFLRKRYTAWGIPEEKISVIENGLHGFRHQMSPKLRTENSTVVFSYFGQINPFKGVDVLMDAVDILSNDEEISSKISIRLNGNIIGIDSKFESKIKNASENYKFFTNCGPYNNNMVLSLMSEADYIVVPSTWWENSPVVIQEAYAAARPVICSGIGGMAEKVIDGVTGLHFQIGRADDLVRVIRKAVNLTHQNGLTSLPSPSSEIDMAKSYMHFFINHNNDDI